MISYGLLIAIRDRKISIGDVLKSRYNNVEGLALNW